MTIDNDDLLALETATATLVKCEDYRNIKEELRIIADTKHGCFCYEFNELNAIVKVARENPRRLNALLKLVEQYRADAEDMAEEEEEEVLHPNGDTVPPPRESPEARKERNREYQRILMRDRRRRQAKALKLYQRLTNQIVPAGQPRKAYYEEVQAMWTVRLNELLRTTGPFSNGDDKNEFRKMFWTDLEADLDRAIQTNDVNLGRTILGLKPGG